MTPESDNDKDPSVLIAHPLPWRSSCKQKVILAYSSITLTINFPIVLNDLINKLDERYLKKSTKEGGVMPKKQRIIGNPSCLD